MNVAKKQEFIQVILDNVLIGLHNTLHRFVLFSFKNMDEITGSKLTVLYMEKETSEHVRFAIKVFKKIIIPASILYVCANLFFFGRNALNSALWGLLIFFYSNFLPDIPSIFRVSKNERRIENLPWYKKYALIIFAPIFILFLFSELQFELKTTETFHNFRSLAIYGVFLLLLGFLLFGNFPISFGRIAEILSLSFYGMAGYLTHLKVDGIL